jgi:O-antigen ligase
MTTESQFIAIIKSRRATDYLAIAVAISLPWSTSATSICLALWLFAFLPTFRFAEIRRELLTPAGGLPIMLVAWAVLGMLWADATWKESFDGLRQFDKLLFIPVLLAYFRESDFGIRAALAFVASCIGLLALSLTTVLWPDLQWWQSWGPGVPVKNYITQSAEFAISAFFLFYLSVEAWKMAAFRFSITAWLIATTFIGFMLFVVTSRTELVAIAALTIVFGARRYGWRGLLFSAATLGVIALVAWSTSSSLRTRINKTEPDMQTYRSDNVSTSTGYRLEFLKKSIAFISAAPLIGHGTGSIKVQFERAAVGKTGISAVITSNPHNQIFAVAIQLGLIGVVILCSMWAAHLLMFVGPGAVAWFGLVVVIQIIIGSLFNTHLFDFTEGWIYVCCVGALGGTCHRNMDISLAAEQSNLGNFGLIFPKITIAE